MNKAAAVVVTYNRVALLKENISSLLGQSRACDILVIDNASTDGTAEYVAAICDERIRYVNTGSNLGGAGGFSYGLRIAEEAGYQYAWIMDDDAVPVQDALESLLRKACILKDEFSFLSSLVYWTDGSIFGMNFPEYQRRKKLDICPDLISKYKLMPVEEASFVGCFINLNISKQIGLPIAEFFIYGDDVEYTLRLRKSAQAYLDFDSVIIHKAPGNQRPDVLTASTDRIDRFYYQSRNSMYIARKRGLHAVVKRLCLVIVKSMKILAKAPDQRGKRLAVLYRGTLAGILFNPSIQYSKNDVESR